MDDWSSCPAVERSPGKVSGAWLFKGTRVPVTALFENLEAGASIGQFGGNSTQVFFVTWFPTYLVNVRGMSFINAGIPGFNPVQDYVGYDVREHHTNVDTAERIRLDDLKQNAIVLASFVYHAANREAMIPSDVRR